MALPVNLQDSASGVAETVQQGTDLVGRAQVQLAQANTGAGVTGAPKSVGAARMFSENDAGEVTLAPHLASPETSEDYRLRTGIDTLLGGDSFNYANQWSGAYTYVTTTMTIVHANGFAVLNNSAIVTATTGAMVQSRRCFPLYEAGGLYGEATVLLTQPPQLNAITQIGILLAASATATPTDGVYFEYNAAGELRGVMMYNSIPSQTGTMPIPTDSATHKYTISIDTEHVEFWIDNVLQAELATPAGHGQPYASTSAPFAVRHYTTGVAPALATQVKYANWTVSLADWNSGMSWQAAMAGQGYDAIQGIGGQTQGQTANYANSAAPASATLSNVAAGYTTLGGQWQFAAVAGAETDYALFAFQVPAAAVAVPGRTLRIYGITVDAFNTVVAVATTATVLQWALAVGATAVSLATAEAATAKAPRRVTLGVQSFAVAAAVGAAANQINVQFATPHVVNPGEFVHVILKMPIATATATEIFRGTVGIDAHWE